MAAAMTWRRDLRPENVRVVGGYRIFSEVNQDRETAHVVVFPDGREIRVLPDGRSGLKRARLVYAATEQAASALEAATGRLVLIGGLADAGLTWEEPRIEVGFEEWLVCLWEDDTDWNPRVVAAAVEREWTVVRKVSE